MNEDCIPLKSGSFTDKTKKMLKGRLAEVSRDASLEERCRVVAALHLEHYPPENMGVLDQEAWNSIIRLKFEKTNPKEGKRRTAAISKHYLKEVEDTNPHLAESIVADKLVWKDLCEFAFPTDGVSRPKGLVFPWPILVERMKKVGRELLDCLSMEEDEVSFSTMTKKIERNIQFLVESAMNVSLLKKSGIGKTIKKFLKQASKCHNKMMKKFLTRKRQVSYLKVHQRTNSDGMTIFEQAEKLLNDWKEIAANSGVVIDNNNQNPEYDDQGNPIFVPSKKITTTTTDCQDLQICESKCISWRTLYDVLHSRESKRRKKQGERLRQRREFRAKNQPKIIKVRPTLASERRERMLSSSSKKHQPMGTKYASLTSSASRGKDKFNALRDESKVAATWSKSTSGTTCQTPSSFGNAVAYASASTRNKQKLKQYQLKGGKSMKVPNKTPVSTLKKRLSKRTYR